MTILDRIRKGETGVLVIGMHAPIVQSMLDFDFLSGKSEPSVVAIVTGGVKARKFFFGEKELLVPCVAHVSDLSPRLSGRVRWALNVQSGRRAFNSIVDFFTAFPRSLGVSIFAENVPEAHAAELIRRFSHDKLIWGPASVGFLVPGSLKLGAVGGVDPLQIKNGKLTVSGGIAVGSTSGGMTNELIRSVINAGKHVSFAAAVGGDRFPVTPLSDLFLLAEADTQTKALVYFGELGGVDEYEIVDLIRLKKFTKPLVAYIAGVIDDAFDEHVQFGHAKALVSHNDESARAKRDALKKAGAVVSETFPEFLSALSKLPESPVNDTNYSVDSLMTRRASILSTRKIVAYEKIPAFVKKGALVKGAEHAYGKAVLEALLGKKIRSKTTSAFIEAIFQLLIDHGGEVSGAVNTMITARAGKDLVSSLSAGLLTIGPRFGGAINDAARVWLSGVRSSESAEALVKRMNASGVLIPGIGHKKYRVDIPDPRVEAIAAFATLLKKHPCYDFARSVEKVTTGKSGSLILNIDGCIAALVLDILAECERYTHVELTELIDAEFCNTLFIIPRIVGFSAHFIEQKRNDEGLFRLPEDLLFTRGSEKRHGTKNK